MSFRYVLLACCVLSTVSAPARAGKAEEAALEARVKALEQRVADLEAKLNAVAARPAAPAAPALTVVPHVAQPGAPAPAPVWGDPAKWAQVRQGMNWSEVRRLLGAPGHTTTGVFGEVWYYPDESGGRVVFDRDSRVAEFNSPPPSR